MLPTRVVSRPGLSLRRRIEKKSKFSMKSYSKVLAPANQRKLQIRVKNDNAGINFLQNREFIENFDKNG